MSLSRWDRGEEGVVQEPVHLSSYGGGQLSVRGLTAEDSSRLEKAIHGLGWARVTDGRVELIDAYQPTPAPTQDPEMLPFWRPHHSSALTEQMELFDIDAQVSSHLDASLSIQALCGYDYTPERYKEEVARLTSYGFVCLRSPRGDDGRYWEVWYLSGLWSARGDLKGAIEACRGKDVTIASRLDQALNFLRSHCQFGSCDASVQRLAMASPD